MGCGESQPAKAKSDPGLESKGQKLPPAVSSQKEAASPTKKAAKPKDGEMWSIKMVLIGDTAVGKSCLIVNYLHNKFTEDYEPTVLDIYKGQKALNKEQVDVEIHDTSGDKQLAESRKVQYAGADVFMLCVAVNKLTSYTNIKDWVAEIYSTTPNKPIMLVLTKSDIEDGAEVTLKMLKEATKKVDGLFDGALKTSSKEWEDFNVHKAFTKTLSVALKYQKNPKGNIDLGSYTE